jgi:hypothetical protein
VNKSLATIDRIVVDSREVLIKVVSRDITTDKSFAVGTAKVNLNLIVSCTKSLCIVDPKFEIWVRRLHEVRTTSDSETGESSVDVVEENVFDGHVCEKVSRKENINFAWTSEVKRVDHKPFADVEEVKVTGGNTKVASCKELIVEEEDRG